MIKKIDIQDKRNLLRVFSNFERLKNMIYRRFAHALVQIYDSIYAIGGYMHTEKPGNDPRSLASCEQYFIERGEWKEV